MKTVKNTAFCYFSTNAIITFLIPWTYAKTWDEKTRTVVIYFVGTNHNDFQFKSLKSHDCLSLAITYRCVLRIHILAHCRRGTIFETIWLVFELFVDICEFRRFLRLFYADGNCLICFYRRFMSKSIVSNSPKTRTNPNVFSIGIYRNTYWPEVYFRALFRRRRARI